MRKRIKGFTLIELLAVIVILAVILLIVVPIVLNVIGDARKGAFESSAMGLVKTAENACMSYALRHDPVARETLFSDGEMSGHELNFTGKPPVGGYVYINEQCEIQLAVHNNEWCAIKDYDELEVTLVPYDGDCGLSFESPDFACTANGTYNGHAIPNLIADGYVPIANANELNNIREQDQSLIFGEGTLYEGIYVAGLDKKYIQLADIDLIDYSSGVGFVPIGSVGLPETGGDDLYFTGIYDGNCYKISNLTINRPDGENIGLFGITWGAVEFKNIIIEEANITASQRVGILAGTIWESGVVMNVQVQGELMGDYYIGGIMGIAWDLKMENLIADVVINPTSGFGSRYSFGGIVGELGDSVVRFSYANLLLNGHDRSNTIGGIAGEAHYSIISDSHADSIIIGGGVIGGLVGELWSSSVWGDSFITNSYANTQIESLWGTFYTGGIVGYASAGSNSKIMISDCYALGTISGYSNGGGLVGWNEGTVKNSYSKVDVELSDNFGGGLIGYNRRGTVINSYSTGNVSAAAIAGGLVGANDLGTETVENSYYFNGIDNGIGEKVTEEQMKLMATYINWDFDNIWQIDGDFPELRLQNSIIMPDNFAFDLDDGSIKGYIGLNKDVIIPSSYTMHGISYPVLKISNSALSYQNFESVTLPDTLEEIGSRSFQDNQIKNLIIPNSVISIESSAFRDNEIDNLILSESVTTIGSYAFSDNILTSLTIPGNVTTINNNAFSYSQIENLIIEEGVTSIASQAFKANQISNLSLPSTLINIGNNAFSENKLPAEQAFIYARNGDGSIDSSKIIGYGGAERNNVIIPNGITTIGEFALNIRGTTYRSTYPFELIKAVTIPPSVVVIENSAFSNNELTSIDLPLSVTTIGSRAFASNQLISVTFTDNVETIGASSFASNQLTELTLPNNVTSIGASSFTNNDISSLSLSNGLTSIPDFAFSNNSLTSVNIPDNITTIGRSAFRDNQLTNVNFPSTVSSIGITAFERNYLTEIIFLRTGTTTMGTNAFRYNGPTQNSGTITSGSRCGIWNISGTSWTRVQTCPLP